MYGTLVALLEELLHVTAYVPVEATSHLILVQGLAAQHWAILALPLDSDSPRLTAPHISADVTSRSSAIL